MFLRTILLLLTAAFSSAAYPQDLQQQGAQVTQSPTPIVQAVMFWEEGCPNCELVLNDFLPGFQASQGSQFSLELVEVVSLDDINRLFRIGEAYGLTRDQIGVPMLVVGDEILVGAAQIPTELPSVVARYLASGGVTTVVREEPVESNLAAEDVQDNGMWLAWLTMLVMAAGLIVTIWQVWIAFDGGSGFRLPAWTDWLTPILTVVGIGVAIYLTFIETTKAQAICGPVGDCNAVQNSKYAVLFGFLPVGVLGLLGYIGILGAWAARRFHWKSIAEFAPVALLGMTAFGTIFSIYLTYLEIFVIHAVCIWCISSAWIMTILMILSLPVAVHWLSGAEE